MLVCTLLNNEIYNHCITYRNNKLEKLAVYDNRNEIEASTLLQEDIKYQNDEDHEGKKRRNLRFKGYYKNKERIVDTFGILTF